MSKARYLRFIFPLRAQRHPIIARRRRARPSRASNSPTCRGRRRPARCRRPESGPFNAEVALTPKLSIGTVSPESIYEARFEGNIRAAGPSEKSGDCEIDDAHAPNLRRIGRGPASGAAGRRAPRTAPPAPDRCRA